MIKIQIGGSPCTYWSIARAATNSPITRETVNKGMGWELFLNYKIALDKFQPDVWLYENVASMSQDIKASISAHFGRDPYQINGGLVSAAERDRFFWSNIEGVEAPAERGMTLPDGYTAGVADGARYKALGNGWTAEVVVHILSYALANVPRDEEIVVLSLYDGIATGRYCLDKMGFKNVTYYAYEIDPKPIEIAKRNWPDIIHLGDAFEVRKPDWCLPGEEDDDEWMY